MSWRETLEFATTLVIGIWSLAIIIAMLCALIGASWQMTSYICARLNLHSRAHRIAAYPFVLGVLICLLPLFVWLSRLGVRE